MMKKIITIIFLTILMCRGGYSQETKELTPSFRTLNPVDIFPADPKSKYQFNDINKNTKPSLFSIEQDNQKCFLTAEVFLRPQSHFAINANFKSVRDINKGDILLARFSMRAIYAKQESGDAVVYFYVQNTSGNRIAIAEIVTGLEWKTYEIPFMANVDAPKGEGEICLSFGSLVQKVEIAGIEVLNFENKTTLSDLPTTHFTYTGREENAIWRRKALKRIDEVRTAPLIVNIVDANGKSVQEARVEAQLIKSDFIWGTSVNEALLGDELPNSAKYKAILSELFNTAIIENGFKGQGWENKTRFLQTKQAFEWLEKEGFRQRGHNLVWPGWKFNSKEIRMLAETDTAAFRKEIETHIREKMAYTKGRVIAWDVINEIWHERDMFNYLPEDEPVKWYRLARELDPNAQLFINEYGMLNSVASPQNIKIYLGYIHDMLSKGAPIDAIGIQGHVGRQPRNPEQVISDFDMFNPLGLPIQITEFDINTPDEELQADYTRDMLIACYSHPLVTGFTKWGFWENAHWKPDAAMFRSDWSAKPNATAWREWVTKRWKTSINERTDLNGQISSRGHLGYYRIKVIVDKEEKIEYYQLAKGSSPLVIKLK
jgi:GH35 family endo-1,4-beta-xylanase